MFKTYKEFLNENNTTKEWYVKWSSWFTSHKYDIDLISKAVKDGGGKDIYTDNQYGWSNQPDVVVFSAKESDLDDIENSVQDAVGTGWIVIRDKKRDWVKEKK